MYEMNEEGDISQDGVPIHLGKVLEALSPSDWYSATRRDRPYSGQPHTDHGRRGETLVKGLTFRDVRDCFILGCFLASGLSKDEWPQSAYDLPWDDMDIVAVAQNMSCEMERRMGIFPNVPPLEEVA